MQSDLAKTGPPQSDPAGRRGLPWRRAAAVLAALLAAGGLAWWLHRRPNPMTRARLESTFQRQGKGLTPLIPASDPRGGAWWSVRFDRKTLATHAVYLSEPDPGQGFVYVGPDGIVHRRGKPETLLADGGEVLFTPTGTTLFLDGLAQAPDLTGWACRWVAGSPAPPERAAHPIPEVSVYDEFMRTLIEDHSYCRVNGGTVALAQHGGGMATSTWQEADVDFQRAVNPFSVFARDGGTVSYGVPGAPYWGDVCAEARFYFGVPKTGNVVDVNTLPTDTDMLVVQGPLDGEQVAFGWCGAARGFRLMTRRAGGGWTVRATWGPQRPPLTNWVRIGLTITRGHLAEGLLDDVAVVQAALPGRIVGPFHVVAGKGLVEFDDVRAWSLPATPGPGSPLDIKSRSFAGKHVKDSSDPPQFREWANSAGVFVRSRSYDRATQTASAAITTAMPLMGDFLYTAVQHSETGGELPPGRYAFALSRPRLDETDSSGTADDGVFTLEAERTETAWRLLNPPPEPTPALPAELPDLALARSAATAWRLAVLAAGQWLPLSPPIPGPVHLTIRRSQSGQRLLFSPTPAHHHLLCRNLFHELFEAAATDWSWVDGAFRMDCRWACQDQWNFMACGSPALPYMTSKRRFGGDQVHECYLCLRPAFPWDAGDSTFVYNAEADAASGFPQIQAHHGWYNRRDLNVSFCSDGLNPLSGYAVVFGGDDNRETRLLRRGEVVASTREWRFLFSNNPEHTAVHWNWWKFTVSKSGNEILVRLNDARLFHYVDPEPLEGGHIGFWSVRNGFGLARLSSMAERVDWRPHDLYVTTPQATGPWAALRGDTVSLTADPGGPGLTRVTNRSGGGSFAVRWTAPAPIDLEATPVLELPLRLGPGAIVSLHLGIGGSSFLLRLGETPLTGIKALLTPEAERGECFQLPDLPVKQLERWNLLGAALPEDGVLRVDLLPRLKALGRTPSRLLLSSITVGNSSNEGYLLAGHGGNQAGAWYAVGGPVLRRAGEPR